MKKKRRRLSVSISILVLAALIVFSACGKKEDEPAEEETWLKKLEQLAVETVLEKSEIKDMISAEDIMVDQIYYGSFSQENANEIFVVCKILHTIHAVTLDRRAGVLLDKDTLQVVAFKDFAGDETEIRCLQTSNGQRRILHLHSSVYQGCRGTSIDLYAVQGSEWVAIPIDDITIEERDYGSFNYYMMGERWVMTWESFPKIKPEQILEPAELIAILDWGPNNEKFVLDTNTEQPVIQQEPAEEESYLSKLKRLAVETIMENSEMNGSMIRDGELEVVIDKIHSGSFSQENDNEIFVDCRLKGMPHAGGLDTRAGILLEADALEVMAYKEFVGDEVMLHCLQTANGQSRILFLGTSAGTGSQAQSVELWGIRDGEWVALPTGIEEFIPEEHKEIVTGINGTETGTGDSFCYMAGGGRLVVTHEEDTAFGVKVPSELSAILDWNPFQERFELTEDNTEQPVIQQK